MFYDIYLDEFIYLKEDENDFKFEPDLFCGINKYNKKECLRFKNGKVGVLKKEKDINEFIKTSRNVFSSNSKLYYGKLDKETSYKIKSVFDKDIFGFNLSLPLNSVKHIFKKHGNTFKEISKGQCPVRNYDFKLLPFIISNFDSLKVSKYLTNFNNQVLIFKKIIEGVCYVIVTFVSFRSRTLEIKTIYKQKKELFHRVRSEERRVGKECRL